MTDEQQQNVETPQSRSFQIPGCSVEVCSEEDGVSIEELLNIVFNLASANPGATVDFGIRVRGDG
ncbi:MAG: hypothetical protein AAFN08_05885 [Cyanobacteria bacterium J06559_3]